MIFLGKVNLFFIKSVYWKIRRFLLIKKTCFFYDSFKYDNLNLDFLNYQSAPSGGVFDFFSLKPFTFSKKAKSMNFEILLENDLLAFEKYYLKNNIFYYDSFDYLQRSTYNLNDLVSSVGYNHGGSKPFILSKLFKKETFKAFSKRMDSVKGVSLDPEIIKNYKKSVLHFNKKFKKYGAFDSSILQANPLLAKDASLKHLDNLLFSEGFKKEDFFAKSEYFSGLPKFRYKGFPINPAKYSDFCKKNPPF